MNPIKTNDPIFNKWYNNRGKELLEKWGWTEINEDYTSELAKWRIKKQEVSEQIHWISRRQHAEYVSTHKWFVRACDIIIAIAILCNLGALFLTNMMVMKAAPATVLTEVNPIAAEMHGLEVHQDAPKLFTGIIIRLFAYALIICMYVWYRWSLKSDMDALMLIVFCIVLAWPLVYDFVNNFGFWVGRLMYGG